MSEQDMSANPTFYTEQLVSVPAGLPEYSIGWDVIDWCEHWLRIPNHRGSGGNWRFTKEQGRFLLWWYAVDKDGYFLYSSGVVDPTDVRGRDVPPMTSLIALAELMGPCRFGGWDDDRQPYGIPARVASVVLAAVEEDLGRWPVNWFGSLLRTEALSKYDVLFDNHYKALRAMVDGSRQKLRVVTPSLKSAEGVRPTIVMLDETHEPHQTHDMLLLSDVLRRNVARARIPTAGATRLLSLTNQNVKKGENVKDGATPEVVLFDCERRHAPIPHKPPTGEFTREAALGVLVRAAMGKDLDAIQVRAAQAWLEHTS